MGTTYCILEGTLIEVCETEGPLASHYPSRGTKGVPMESKRCPNVFPYVRRLGSIKEGTVSILLSQINDKARTGTRMGVNEKFSLLYMGLQIFYKVSPLVSLDLLVSVIMETLRY